MASATAVADKRAKADLRLAKAALAASKAFGVPFHQSKLPANRFPDLVAAEQTENVAAFLEQITANQKGS